MFESELKKIKPNKKEVEEVSAKVIVFLHKLNSNLKYSHATVGGSFAKGTWLKGSHDIDVFVVFEHNKDLSSRLENAIKKSFGRYEKIHGSRDYFLVNFKGLSFELVPVLKIERTTEAKNITDVSPMHVNWVKDRVDDKLQDDIRLAKYFLKINKCYGAETYIGGFSGYVAELLVIYYKGFKKFINNARKWKYGKKILLGKHDWYKHEQEFPLIVVDPVQPNRNASAALSKEKFNEFVSLSDKFVKSKYSNKFFKEKKVNLKKYDLVFKVTPLEGSKDVVGTKMLKCKETISRRINEEGFGVLESGWIWYGKEAYFYYKTKNKELSKEKIHFGPPL